MVPGRNLLFLVAMLGSAAWIADGKLTQAEPELRRRQDITEVVATVIQSEVTPGSTRVTTLLTTSQLSKPSRSSSTTSTLTTQSPTATGTSCDTGYTLCGAAFNGGCCLSGYSCGISSCIPPSDTSSIAPSRTCTAAGYTLCPASVNYGCCLSGYGCGLYSCTASGAAIAPVTKPPDQDGNTLKHSATATSSPTATPSPTSGGGGGGGGGGGSLSKFAIGGIVAGSLFAIVALSFAWWLTTRALRRRGNTDVAGGVPTSNFFDPHATFARNNQISSRYRPPRPPPNAGFLPRNVPVAVAPPPQAPAVDPGFDFGLGQGGYEYQPVDQHPPPAEMGTSSATSQRWSGGTASEEVYEVEGTRTQSDMRASWGWNRSST